MSQSLDVKIAERIKSRLLDRDVLIDFFKSIAPIHNNDDFFTYYTTHYGTEGDDNVHLFIDDHRHDLWDELNYCDEKNEYFSNEEIDEISVVDTIKLFKAAVALIDDEDDDGLNDYVNAYANNDWRMIARYYISNMVDKLITDYRHQIAQIVYTYIKDLAIEKIKHNQLFFCGLGLKLSMRDCGIELST